MVTEEPSSPAPSPEKSSVGTVRMLNTPIQYHLQRMKASIGRDFVFELPTTLGIKPDDIIALHMNICVTGDTNLETWSCRVVRHSGHKCTVDFGGESTNLFNENEFNRWWSRQPFGALATPADVEFVINRVEVKKDVDSPRLQAASTQVDPEAPIAEGSQPPPSPQTSEPTPSETEVAERLGIRPQESLFAHAFKRRGWGDVQRSIVKVFQDFVGPSRLKEPVQLYLYVRTGREGLLRDIEKRLVRPFPVKFIVTNTSMGPVSAIWTTDERVCAAGGGRPRMSFIDINRRNRDDIRIEDAMRDVLQEYGIDINSVEFFLSSAPDLHERDGTTELIDEVFGRGDSQ